MKESLSPFDRACSLGVGAVLVFAALAKAAHDLWAATAVHLAVLLLAAALVAHRTWSKNSPGLRTAYEAPLLAIAAVLFLSFRQSIHPAESLMALKDWCAGLLLFWIAVNVFTAPASVRLLVLAAAPLFFIELPLNIRQKLNFPLIEPMGTFVNANIQASFLLFWLPVLIHQALESWRAKSRARNFWALTLAAALINLAFSMSTLAWILFIASLPFLNGLGPLRKILRRHRKLSLAIGLALVLFIGFLVYAKFRSDASLPMERYQSNTRVAYWLTGLRMFRDHPWFGLGLGNFGSGYLAYKVGVGQHTLHAHGSLIGWLSETGVFGFLALCVFLLLWIGRSLRAESREGRWPYVLGVLLFLGFSLINISFAFFINLIVLFVFMGLVSSVDKTRRWILRPSFAALFLTASVAAVPFVVSPLLASQHVVTARDHLQNGRWDLALKSASSAAALDPLSPEAERCRAASYYQLYLSSGDSSHLADAVRHQRRAVELNELQGFLWWELGRYLQAQGRMQEALTVFEKAVQLHATNETFQKDRDLLRRELRQETLW